MRFWPLLLLLLLLLFGGWQAPAAASGIQVNSQAAQNRFPRGVDLTIFLTSDAEITTVRLLYQILPDSGEVFARPQCTTGRAVNCTVTIGNTPASYMVPGAELVYYWEIEDAAGNRLRTEERRTTYHDDRFRWESISEGNVTVYFYFGSEESNRAVLRTARETIDRFSRLLRTEIDFPVKVWVYQTARELSDAAAGRPPATGHTLGQVSASDTALVSRDSDFLNVVRHELAHIVTRRATRSAQPIAGLYSRFEIPTWVNEGISNYAQTRLLAGEEQALALAIRQNRVLPLSSLSGAFRSNDFPLAYAQSGAIVKFMIETWGDEKFADFVAAFRDNTTDGALQKVYGMDQLGLENAWRRSVGLPPVTAAQTGPAVEAAIPTIVPFGAQPPQPAATPAARGPAPATQDRSDSDSGSVSAPLPLIAGVVVALALLAGAGYYLARRRPHVPPGA